MLLSALVVLWLPGYYLSRPESYSNASGRVWLLLTLSLTYTLSLLQLPAGKGEEEEGGESDEPDLTASADLEDSR